MDSESDMYFLRARYYDPDSGRFISRDSVRGILSQPQTQNPYVYSGNNPGNVGDPSGNYIESAWDIANISYDIATFNPCDPWSYINTGVDVASLAVPFLPAGSTKVLKAGLVADKGKDVKFIDHALTQMEKRGVSVESAFEALEKGSPSSGNKPNRTVFDLPVSESSTGRAVRTVLDDLTGEIITVINKGSK